MGLGFLQGLSRLLFRAEILDKAGHCIISRNDFNTLNYVKLVDVLKEVRQQIPVITPLLV